MTKKSFCFAIITNEWKFVEIHIEFLLSSFCKVIVQHLVCQQLQIGFHYSPISNTPKKAFIVLIHSCEKAKIFVLFFISITIFLFSFNFFRNCLKLPDTLALRSICILCYFHLFKCLLRLRSKNDFYLFSFHLFNFQK